MQGCISGAKYEKKTMTNDIAYALTKEEEDKEAEGDLTVRGGPEASPAEVEAENFFDRVKFLLEKIPNDSICSSADSVDDLEPETEKRWFDKITSYFGKKAPVSPAGLAGDENRNDCSDANASSSRVIEEVRQ